MSQSGDQSATIISLCSLQDMNLYNDHCQMSIIDAGGLEVLINLLESEDTNSMVRTFFTTELDTNSP